MCYTAFSVVPWAATHETTNPITLKTNKEKPGYAYVTYINRFFQGLSQKEQRKDVPYFAMGQPPGHSAMVMALRNGVLEPLILKL